MATSTASQLNQIDREFDCFLVSYSSLDLGDPATAGTKAWHT